jgi:hypothetical protein
MKKGEKTMSEKQIAANQRSAAFGRNQKGGTANGR